MDCFKKKGIWMRERKTEDAETRLRKGLPGFVSKNYAGVNAEASRGHPSSLRFAGASRGHPSSPTGYAGQAESTENCFFDLPV
jgi:hypothetical protein